jgi:hypothetical protein
MRNTLTLRLSEDLRRWLEDESRATKLPMGRIVRDHLDRARLRKACQPFLELAGAIDGKRGLSRKRGFER